MRVVFDTNIIISGRLWSGNPRQALTAIEQRRATLLISEAMLDELKDVIHRDKFAERLKLIGKTAGQLIREHLQITEVVEAAQISPIVEDDPDDDVVLACALGGNADCIVTGDPHLLNLSRYENIDIISARAFLDRLDIFTDN